MKINVESNLLQPGDVFEVTSGMKVYTDVPKCYIYANTPYDYSYTKNDINSGEILTRSKFNKKALSKDIIDVFNSVGIKINENDSQYIIDYVINKNTEIKNIYDTKYLLGDYVVVDTTIQGGSSSFLDYYPDGYYVKAIKLNSDGTYNPNGTKISFYQTGCFSAVNPSIKVKREMKRTVKYV